MADNQFNSTEEKGSYGIGMQMGQQLSSAFPGVSLSAALAGIQDAFEGNGLIIRVLPFDIDSSLLLQSQ